MSDHRHVDAPCPPGGESQGQEPDGDLRPPPRGPQVVDAEQERVENRRPDAIAVDPREKIAAEVEFLGQGAGKAIEHECDD